MPRYPVYPSQPNSGNLPTMQEMGPSDLRASSGTAPYYQAQIDAHYGRNLAGVGAVQDEAAEPAWASNELELAAAADDIQSSGIFDPPGTHPNIHPDAGIFAAHYSLPGYHAREKPFSMTEVRDVTTGRPVRAVPSGAVALDSAAQIAFLERGLYAPPKPVIDAEMLQPMPSRSTVNVFQNPEPIGALPENSGRLLLVALAGLALGAAIGVAKKGKAR